MSENRTRNNTTANDIEIQTISEKDLQTSLKIVKIIYL